MKQKEETKAAKQRNEEEKPQGEEKNEEGGIGRKM